jgi:hypothetical protein
MNHQDTKDTKETFGKEMCDELKGRGYPVLEGIFDRQAQFMSSYNWQGKTVLELGAWDGRHSEVALTLGAMFATVVEGRKENLKDAHPAWPERVQYVVQDIRELDNDIEEADVLLIFGVLYHLDNPVKFLRHVLGTYCLEAVFIWTHVAGACNSQCEGYVGQNYGDPGREGNDALSPLTAFWFRRDELVRCLEENGFRVVKMVDIPTPRHPGQAVCVWAERKIASSQDQLLAMTEEMV